MQGDACAIAAGTVGINATPVRQATQTLERLLDDAAWFGGVRGIWYRKDQFAKAGITSPPTTWAQLLADAKLLMKKYPGTYGLGAPSNFTNGIVSFIWGAGGQVAVQNGGKWTAELTSPQSEAGIKFYADLYRTEHVSPSKYIGQTELGAPGATSGGSDEDFAKGTLDMTIDGPGASWTDAGDPSDPLNHRGYMIVGYNGIGGPAPFSGAARLRSGAIWTVGRAGVCCASCFAASAVVDAVLQHLAGLE